MNNKIRALAVGMLSTLGLTFAGGAAMAATAPTLLAKVGTTAATIFSPTSTPLVVSTEDVDSDDSAGCIVEFDNFTGDYTAADYSQLTDVGGANPTKFSEFTKTFTWTESFEALDGKKVAFVFYQAETCDKTDPEAWLESRGVEGDAEVVFTIDAGEADPEPEVAAPGAPATVTVGTINATNAKVTWTAPTTGGAVTSYVVLVGTTSVGTFGSTVLTANLTGLTPNTDYTVTVKAVNAGGEGTKAATFKTADATKSGKIEMAAKVGETVAGTKTTITATGLKPGEDYTIVLRSDPVTLASGKVADNGNLTQEVTLPTIAAGDHTITLTSKYWDGSALSTVVYFTVDADGKLTEVTTTAPELAETGLNLILPIGLAAVFAAAGVGFVVNGVRRRATANA